MFFCGEGDGGFIVLSLICNQYYFCGHMQLFFVHVALIIVLLFYESFRDILLLVAMVVSVST